MSEVKRFGDLETHFDDVDEWVAFNSLVGKEILVHDYIIAEGQFGEYALIKFTDQEDGKLKATTTGGSVVIKKLNMAKERNLLPLIGKVIKVKRYYNIV